MSDTTQFPRNTTPGSSPQANGPSVSAVDSLKESVAGAVDRGKAGIADSASTARESFGQDFSQLKADIAKMQDTLAKFASQSGSAAANTARDLGQAVSSQVGNAASEMAATATEQAKTFASELEGMARRNPLGTLAGTLVVGVLIGMLSRNRS